MLSKVNYLISIEQIDGLTKTVMNQQNVITKLHQRVAYLRDIKEQNKGQSLLSYGDG
jgi:hypothetical protein